MAFKAFPAKRYHATESPRIFASQADLDAAGPGWVDEPSAAVLVAEPPAPGIVCGKTNDTGVCGKAPNHRGGCKFVPITADAPPAE